MDLREFIRGFFGLNRQTRQPQMPCDDPKRPSYGNIPPVNEIEDRNDPNPGHLFLPTRPDMVFGIGDMFSAIEDMFKDVEQSMKDFDEVFQDFSSSDSGGFGLFSFPPGELDGIPRLPGPEANKGENVRDLVLKYDEELQVKPNSEKIDKSLDELHEKSILDLSELPILKPSTQQPNNIRDIDPSYKNPNMNSTFERVFSTYSFNNGKWEGKTVRENENGKEVTTYFRNEKGELNETTQQFYPKTQDTNPFSNSNTTHEQRILPPFNPFSLFERFFKS